MQKYSMKEESSCSEKTFEEDQTKTAKQVSIFPASLNITNTIIGGGLLEMPYVMMNFGIVASLCILLFVYGLTIMSVMLLVEINNLTNIQDYYKISQFTFGSVGGWVTNFCILSNCIGTCIAYLVIILNVSNELLVQGFQTDPDSWWNLNYVRLSAACLCILPFIYVKSTRKLKLPSVIMIFVIPGLLFVIIYDFFKNKNPAYFNNLNILPNFQQMDWKKAIESGPSVILGIVVFSLITSQFIAFTFTFNFFPIQRTLRNPTYKRSVIMSVIGVTIPLLFYSTISIFGYIEYQNKVQPNYLQTIQIQNIGKTLYLLLYFSFLVNIIVGFPLVFFEGKNILLKLVDEQFFFKKKTAQMKELEMPLVQKSDSDQILLGKEMIGCDISIREGDLGDQRELRKESYETRDTDESQSQEERQRRNEGLEESVEEGRGERQGGVEFGDLEAMDHADHGHAVIEGEKVVCLDMPNYLQKIIITLFFISIAVVALYIPGINVVFAYVGATGSNAVSFLMPAIFYLKTIEVLSQKENGLQNQKKRKHPLFYKVASIILITFGSIAMIGILAEKIFLKSN